MAVVSCVGLLHWVAAAVWSAQEDFRWLALGSVLGVGIGAAGYVWWWWGRGRGSGMVLG